MSHLSGLILLVFISMNNSGNQNLFMVSLTGLGGNSFSVALPNNDISMQSLKDQIFYDQHVPPKFQR